MMVQLTTLLDKSYFSRARTLIDSLDSFNLDFHLWVFCIDDGAWFLFQELGHQKITALKPSDWENDQLKSIRQSRTNQEYCWTLTPFTISEVFRRETKGDFVFYIDSDVFFMKDPYPLMSEIFAQDVGVFITQHNFLPELKPLERFGLFNVQFLGVHRSRGKEILETWEDQCIDWCFSREDDGKYGDQKYLDAWPAEYGHLVRVGEPSGLFQGPWNAGHSDPSDAMTCHFSSLELLPKRYVRMANSGYPIPGSHVERVFRPYVDKLRFFEAQLSRRQPLLARARKSLRIQSDSLARKIANLRAGRGFVDYVVGKKNIVRFQ